MSRLIFCYNKIMWYKDLNYNHYQEYVNGPEWREIKDYYYENCGVYECRIDKKKRGLLLHKRSYQYLTLDSIKERYIFKYFIKRYLKKNMVWLCFPCNREVHFDDEGKTIELTYSALWKREQLIYRRHNAWYYKLLRARPSSFFGLFTRT